MIGHGYLHIYRLLFDCWWDLARRVGQCGLHRHDQDSSYDDLGFFLPDMPGVDVISTSQSSRSKAMHSMARGRRGRGNGANRGGRAVCADSEASEHGPGYGDGGGFDCPGAWISRARDHIVAGCSRASDHKSSRISMAAKEVAES
jgi:hypothetical protein